MLVSSNVWSKVQSRLCAKVVLLVKRPKRKARLSTLLFACVLALFTNINTK
jgi:hypothetical protein